MSNSKVTPLDSLRHQTGQANNKTKTPRCCNKLPDVLGGVIFITAGIILLLNNFNIISWSIWDQIAVFWPVVFVFIGLDVISGNSLMTKIITTAIGLFIIAFIITFSLTTVDVRFRNQIFKNFSAWKSVYQVIPKMKPYEPGVEFNRNIEDDVFDRTDHYLN